MDSLCLTQAQIYMFCGFCIEQRPVEIIATIHSDLVPAPSRQLSVIYCLKVGQCGLLSSQGLCGLASGDNRVAGCSTCISMQGCLLCAHG